MTDRLKPHGIDTEAVTTDGQTLAYRDKVGEVVWVSKSVPVILMPHGSLPLDLPRDLPIGTIILVKET